MDRKITFSLVQSLVYKNTDYIYVYLSKVTFFYIRKRVKQKK